MIANKKKELHGIYGVWHKPFWQTTPFYLSTFIFFSLLLTLISFMIVKKIKQRKKAIPLWDQALFELNALHHLDCTTREKGKYIYATMTDTLKSYLNQRYGYDILSKTDDELLFYLEQHGFNPKLKQELSDVFSGSILVKFAKEQAIKTQVESHIAKSIRLIKKTIPKTTEK